MWRSILACLAICSVVVTPTYAEPLWNFTDASINYLDWSSRTKNDTGRNSFAYLELEGGAGYRWGELYGFFDVENPTYGKADRRSAAKGVVRFNLGVSPWHVYSQVYDFRSDGFLEQNQVLGIGRSFSFESGWLKPFIGVHHADTTYFHQWNGGMTGWALMYDQTIAAQHFRVTDWTEIEFSRHQAYLVDAQGASQYTGINGALGLWWLASKDFTLGLQYRYADRKLGSATYQDALIYSLRLDF